MKHISIKTKLPHPSDLKLIQELNRYESRSMQGQIPIVWDKADDYMVYDRHGNSFIDFTSGICVANAGHGNTDICSSLRKHINKPLLHSYTFPTEIRCQFLKELVNYCYPYGKAFLVSAGTEATEVAVKLMRMYGKNTGREVIASFTGAMHGRTYIAENLKGGTLDNKWATEPKNHIFENMSVPRFTKDKFLGFRDPSRVAGVIIESYQGWSAYFYPKQFIQDLVSYCRKHKILVCFDEIQSGFGRTGRLWAWEHYDIFRPDLICFGKGCSSSVPLSGVIGRREILDIPASGSMSSTHSANPLACSAGLANLHQLQSKHLVRESEQKGLIFAREMFTYLFPSYITKVQGKGLLWAIITENEKQASRIVLECFKRGLLLIWTHKNSIKIAPPLTITEEAMLEGLKVLKEVICDKSN